MVDLGQKADICSPFTFYFELLNGRLIFFILKTEINLLKIFLQLLIENIKKLSNYIYT